MYSQTQCISILHKYVNNVTIKEEKMCVVAGKKHLHKKLEDKEQAQGLAEDSPFWKGHK